MPLDNATANLLNYGSVGAMLVLSVLAIMWLAKEFKKQTDDNTARFVALNAEYKQQSIESDLKNDALIKEIIGKFTTERNELMREHREERKEFSSAIKELEKTISENTRVMQSLYNALEKREKIEIHP